MKLLLKCFVLFSLSILESKYSFSQNDRIRSFDFEIPIGNSETNSEGLTVSARQIYFKVDTMPGSGPLRLKNVIAFEITIQNTGIQDIAVYEWAFAAICPGSAGNSNTIVNLTTASIPEQIFIILKPADRRVLVTTRTDFFRQTDPRSPAVPIQPTHIRADMVCNLEIPDPAFQDISLPGMEPAGEQAVIDPLLMNLIQEYHDVLATGDLNRAEEKKQDIIEITNSLFRHHKWLVLQKLDNNKFDPSKYERRIPGNSLDLPAELIPLPPAPPAAESPKPVVKPLPKDFSSDASFMELIEQYKKSDSVGK